MSGRDSEGFSGGALVDGGATMPHMSQDRSRMIWAVTAYVALIAIPQVILSAAPPEDLDPSITPTGRVIGLAVDAVWVLALIALMTRQPTSQLWKILVLWEFAGALWALGYIPIEPYALIGVPLFLFGDLWAAVFFHLLLAYPSGHLAHVFDRRFVTFAYAYAIGVKAVVLMLTPDPCWPVCDNPFRLVPSETLAQLVTDISLVLIPILMVVALVELWRHWKARGPAGRRATWPMVLAAPIWCATVFAGYYADAYLDEAAQIATHTWNPFTLVQALIIPSAILVGVLRTQLARANVADLAVELGRGVPVGGLRDVLARAMRDPTLQLAFPAPAGDGYVDPAGRRLEIPERGDRAVTRVERDGEELAVLIHDPVDLVEDPGLVDAVGSIARLALQNERLAAQVQAQLEEVRASRERIVEAGDAERRRVERDLHDGAQQRLVALAMRLQLARDTTTGAAALIDEATAELQTAVAEVRSIARGLHPTILTELGLAAAVHSLAERTPIPIDVDIPERRFSETVESTAYYVVAEAITNVTRYADASSARVVAWVDADRLVVEVQDDGRGGADERRGSGLRGLADRVAVADGRLEILSPPGVGTTIRATLPLA